MWMGGVADSQTMSKPLHIMDTQHIGHLLKKILLTIAKSTQTSNTKATKIATIILWGNCYLDSRPFGWLRILQKCQLKCLMRMAHMVSWCSYNDIFFFFISFQVILVYLVTWLMETPLPCKTTQTHTKFLYETIQNNSAIGISFSSKVRITKTDLVRPTFTNFLSEVGLIWWFALKMKTKNQIQVGGSMGLWLGLGVVQMFELLVNCLALVLRNFKVGNKT